MFALTLAAALLAGAPAPPSAEIFRVIPLEDIRDALVGDYFPLGAPDGRMDAILLMHHGGTLALTSISLMEIDTANMELKIQVAADDDKPGVFRTVYVDIDGRTHEVVTDCKRFSTFKACAKSHAAMLAAIEELFPRRTGTIDFNEENPRYPDMQGSGAVLIPNLLIQAKH